MRESSPRPGSGPRIAWGEEAPPHSLFFGLKGAEAMGEVNHNLPGFGLALLIIDSGQEAQTSLKISSVLLGAVPIPAADVSRQDALNAGVKVLKRTQWQIEEMLMNFLDQGVNATLTGPE